MRESVSHVPVLTHASLPETPSDVLHGIVVPPPVPGWDGRAYRGSRLQDARLDDARAMPGVVAVVRQADFVGVAAVSQVHAEQAVGALAAVWQSPAPSPAPVVPAGDAYEWHIGALDRGQACVIVWAASGHAGIWMPSCSRGVAEIVRREVATLLGLPTTAVSLTQTPEQAGPASLSILDAAADAALLSQASRRPVAVRCRSTAPDRLVLHAPASPDTPQAVWPVAVPPAAAPGNAAGKPLAPPLQALVPWAMRPSMARLSSAHADLDASARPGAVPVDAVRTSSHAWLAAPGDVDDLNAAQVFAQESWWCEQAMAGGHDPHAWRVEHLACDRARALARRVAEQAQWEPTATPARATLADGRWQGRGFATAQTTGVDENGSPQTVWSAWVAEVAVEPRTGHVEVTRIVAGRDSRQLQDADVASVGPAVVDDDVQLLARARGLLGVQRRFDDWHAAGASATPDAGGALARRDTAMTPAMSEGALSHGSLAVDGVVTLPAAAAIANAIHDATGIRLRRTPFDTEALRLALAQRDRSSRRGLRRGWGWLAAGAAGVAGLAAMAWPLKSALPLTSGPDVSLYSAQAIERGRLVAAAGDCVACHTAPHGAPNAGGFGLETPFGTIYSTNITPDNDTGIGRWSYAAFERAMRQGIHQDGRQLYPAFPYTAFAKLSDGDIQALYAYLMSQPAVKAKPAQTRLAFPYNLRPAIAGWNLLFHDATPFTPDPAQDMVWNRGAYLVQGAGHCAACHSPRNALGAEKGGIHYLAGGQAEGWDAPALNRLGSGPLPWTRDDLYQYLRTGHASRHGVAAGPMAPVIHGLAALPDSDIDAMVTYLMDLPGDAAATPVSPATTAAPVPAPVAPAAGDSPVFATHVNGERIYQNACAVCHEANSGPTLFGVKPMLGLNTNLHAATPDNLIQVILHGIQNPADDALGYMPGFSGSLDDVQIADLLGYLRARFAPQEPAWQDVASSVGRVREAAPAGHE